MKKILSIMLTVAMMLATLMALAVPASADDVVTDTWNPSDENPTISTADDYINFFNYAFNSGSGRILDGKTITMLHDITLNDTSVENWYALENTVKLTNTDTVWRHFCGIFDGNGHTLKGVVVKGEFRNNGNLGIFPHLTGGAIKNLTIDGFYVCASTTQERWWGTACTGGLVGRATDSYTIDSVTMRNGIVTATENSTSALGALVGYSIGQTPGQTVKITNTVVEESVEVIAASENQVIGGIFGYIQDHHGSADKIIDVTASRITPAGSMDEDITLKPIGEFNGAGDKDFVWTLKNESTEYSQEITMGARNPDGTSDKPAAWYTDDWYDMIIASGCYGSECADLAEYTVTWSVNDIETTETYVKGATPSFKGSTDKPMTNSHIYTFKGWDKEIVPVTADVTYTAQYEEYAKIVVTWVVDGKTTVEYYGNGEFPNYKGETDKEQDDDYVYTFKGWDKTIAEATEDVTYTAVYDKKAKYEITWVIDGEETKEIYLEGTKPSYKGKVEKAEDDEYTYKFTGWDKEIVAACEDAVYTAQFEKTAKNPSAADDTTDAAGGEEGGCGSSISLGLVTVLAVGMAGAVVARKKKD